ncbi:MAG: hypothetical protein ETSY1_27215 [Candidatus Entotheonella factor]|uniref:Thioredoxin domain-containing protein n=1 Tax=Entotheonella factor TaxID=1429438 RepID=W4LEA9_ENTF1|nr:MAG: hypothetical protein ETSY1_27215 [Candidatus Entotheonella factor]
MYRLLYFLIMISVGSHITGLAADAMPHRALLKAAGFSVAEPVKAAPAVTLNDYQGQPLALQDQRGKVILVNFWATWCPPCIHEMPMMDQLFLSMQGHPFSLWAFKLVSGHIC